MCESVLRDLDAIFVVFAVQGLRKHAREDEVASSTVREPAKVRYNSS